MQAVVDAHAVWNKRVSTNPLNRWFEDAVSSHPPPAVSGPAPQAQLHHAGEGAPAELRAVLLARRRGPGSLPALSRPRPARDISTCPARRSASPCARRTIRSRSRKTKTAMSDARRERQRAAAARPSPSSSSPCCSTCWRSASSSRCCPASCVGFIGGDTARAARNPRPVRHRLGADAVPVLAAARRAVRPLRPPAGDPDLVSRARPRLHPDGACAVAVVAVRRPRHLRHHGGELLDRLCLRRRRDAARAARRALRHARRRVRRRLRPRAGARRPCRQHRSAPAVLDRGGARPRQCALRLADPAGVAAAENRAWRSRGAAPIRSAR